MMSERLNLPDYWIPRPAVTLSDEEIAAFQQIWSAVDRLSDSTPLLVLPPSVQPWHFLDWLVRTENVLLHGSVRGDIELFRPRKPNDHSADDFSKQTGVYATTDAIWSIYYAVLDRGHGRIHLNACLQFQQRKGWTGLRYFFSVDRHSLAQNPWRQGFVYVLPAEGFLQQDPYSVQAWTVLDPHFANLKEVKPLARISVRPRDFPLLSAVREHEDARVFEARAHDPFGFPWIGEQTH